MGILVVCFDYCDLWVVVVCEKCCGEFVDVGWVLLCMCVVGEVVCFYCGLL